MRSVLASPGSVLAAVPELGRENRVFILLRVEQSRERTARLRQIVPGASFDDSTLVHHQNLVGGPNRRESVRDHD